MKYNSEYLLEICRIYKLNPDDYIFSTGVINPHEKSEDSLKSKIIRKIEKENRSNFTLKDLPDMARCSILIDSFDDAPKLIMTLKDNMPLLTGDLSIKSSGYRGIHLHYPIDGVETEIQISTPEAFRCKRITDSVYDAFRDCQLSKMLKEIQTESIKNRQASMLAKENPHNKNLLEKAKLEKQYFEDFKNSKYQEYLKKQHDEGLERAAFQELHKSGEFARNQDVLRGMLAGYTALTEHPEIITPEGLRYAELLNTPIPKTALLVVDVDKVVPLVREAHLLSGELQHKLLDEVEKSSKHFDKNSTLFLPENMQQIIALTTDIQHHYFAELLQKTTPEIIDGNIKKFTDQAFDIEVESIKYANKANLLGRDTRDILFKMHENGENITRLSQKELLERLERQSERDKEIQETFIKMLS